MQSFRKVPWTYILVEEMVIFIIILNSSTVSLSIQSNLHSDQCEQIKINTAEQAHRGS